MKWPKITFRGPILVPAIFGTPKIAKTPRFNHFGGTKNDTLGARIKILRPLFNTN